MSERARNILEWIECVVIAVVLAVLIKYYIGTPTVVQQESMYPTLEQNDRLILNRISRTKKETPNRGDIITFEAPSVKYISTEQADLNNPVAIYDYEPTNVFSKFTYYVLEWGKTSYIKRVIGLPGEHVQIANGKVYINGEELDESEYLQDGVYTDNYGGEFSDFVVPEGYVFAMGDNRTKSADCRRFGCIPIEKIEGKVSIRFWPLNKFGTIKKAE
ncbi:MAG: signal peptidase I [Clostridia bacterium]